MALPSSTSLFFSNIVALTLIISTTSIAIATPTKCNTKNTLVIKECIATHFPTLCCKAMSPFATTVKNNPRKLCKAGIIASIRSTRHVLTLLQNVTFVDGDAVSGCNSDFRRSVGEIKEALSQYNANVKEANVGIFKDAVVTYTLGALSDEEFCLEQLRQSGIKAHQKKVYAAILQAVKLKKITASFINRL